MVLDNITNISHGNTSRSDEIVKASEKPQLRGLQRTPRASAPAVGGSAAAPGRPQGAAEPQGAQGAQASEKPQLRGLQRTPRASAPAVGGSAAAPGRPQGAAEPQGAQGAQARGRSADGRGAAPASREASPARGAAAGGRGLAGRLGTPTASSAARNASARGRERAAEGAGSAAPARRAPAASRERSAGATSPRARSEDRGTLGQDGDRGTWANALWDQQERHEALRAAVAEKEQRLAELRQKASASRARGERCLSELESVAAAYGPSALEAQDKRQSEFRSELATARTTLAAEEEKGQQLDAGLRAKASDLERHKARLQELRLAKTEKVAEVEAKVRLSAGLAEAEAETRRQRERKRELQAQGVAVNRGLHNGYLSLKGNIRVFCRLRPRLHGEADEDVNISIQEESKLSVRSSPQRSVTGLTERSTTWDFEFDHVFGVEASQSAVFEEIALLIQSALDGYKVAIFAYGQTGSGKTHTMAGEPSDPGAIPRAVDLIFAEIQELRQRGWHFEVHATLLEVYNEVVHDVLASKSSAEAPAAAPSAAGAQFTARRVEDAAAVHALLRRAARQRHVAATACNDRSSRSHAVFQLAVEGRHEQGGRRREVSGLLSLVDLAGSERVEKSGAVGERLKEAQFINRSLSALGDVIEALGRKGHHGKENHVPYRNSRLTSLLKDSLGGDSKTLMFVNISPCAHQLTETLSSLRFASKVHACTLGVARRHVAEGPPAPARAASAAPQPERARRRSRSCPASPERRGGPAAAGPGPAWRDLV